LARKNFAAKKIVERVQVLFVKRKALEKLGRDEMTQQYGQLGLRREVARKRRLE